MSGQNSRSPAPIRRREARLGSPASTCPQPSSEVPCPHVADTRTAVEPQELARRPALQTTQQMGHQRQPAHQLATDGVLVRAKYETLPDHLTDITASEILSSDRFLSTAADSYTLKRRDRCLNSEPTYRAAPSSGSVQLLGQLEERLRGAPLAATRPRRSQYTETFGPHREHGSAAAAVVPRRPPLTTDALPRHVYTATSGVAARLNPFLSTTSKDFQPVSAAAARRYRDEPPANTFTGDPVLPQPSAPQPRWHRFTSAVPHAGLRTEALARFGPPRLDWCSRHNWTVSAAAPLVVPPTTHQLMGEAQFQCESENYGAGRHNSVALSCGGLVGRQRHRRRLCSLRLDEPSEASQQWADGEPPPVSPETDRLPQH